MRKFAAKILNVFITKTHLLSNVKNTLDSLIEQIQQLSDNIEELTFVVQSHDEILAESVEEDEELSQQEYDALNAEMHINDFPSLHKTNKDFDLN